MYGFACLWNIDDEPLARRMIEKISHRGPDQTRVYRTDNVPASSVSGLRSGPWFSGSRQCSPGTLFLDLDRLPCSHCAAPSQGVGIPT